MLIFDSDFSYLEGTNCYCSEDSARQIRELISEAPTAAIHLLGTGDYHYCSLFWAEKIDEDFALVLMDQHPDDQASAFDQGLLSCGSWLEQLRKLPHFKAELWINGKGESARGDISEIGNLPIFLSIDLDILSTECAVTDWDQGELSLEQLLSLIRSVKEGRRLIAADICGGITESKGGSEEDFALNRRATEAVIAVLQETR